MHVWMNIKLILPNKRSQFEKALYCMISFSLTLWADRSIETVTDQWLQRLPRRGESIWDWGRRSETILYDTVMVDLRHYAFVTNLEKWLGLVIYKLSLERVEVSESKKLHPKTPQ